MTVDNNKQQKIKKNSEARLRANHKYNAKTYKHKAIYIKLKDLQTIDDFLKSRNQSATQYFYSCLKRDGVIE
jgi:hypothetical protein